MNHKPKIVTITGSMLSWDAIDREASRLTEQGAIVLVPFSASSAYTDFNMDALLELHRSKIRMSDELLAINNKTVNSDAKTVGNGTMDAINFAHAIGVSVSYTHPAGSGPEVITMIGSSRFIDKFRELESQFAMEGILSFTPYRFSYVDLVGRQLTEEEEQKLDELHRTKMQVSTKVLVVNPGGYIGKDTLEEIKWAIEHHIEVTYLEAPGEELIYGG